MVAAVVCEASTCEKSTCLHECKDPVSMTHAKHSEPCEKRGTTDSESLTRLIDCIVSARTATMGLIECKKPAFCCIKNCLKESVLDNKSGIVPPLLGAQIAGLIPIEIMEAEFTDICHHPASRLAQPCRRQKTRAGAVPCQGHHLAARVLPPRRAGCGDTRRRHDHVRGSNRPCSAEGACGGGSWRGGTRSKAATKPPAGRPGRGSAQEGDPGCGACPAVAAARRLQCRAAHRAQRALGAQQARSRPRPRRQWQGCMGSGWSAARFGGSSPAAFQTRVLPWLSWTRAWSQRAAARVPYSVATRSGGQTM